MRTNALVVVIGWIVLGACGDGARQVGDGNDTSVATDTGAETTTPNDAVDTRDVVEAARLTAVVTVPPETLADAKLYLVAGGVAGAGEAELAGEPLTASVSVAMGNVPYRVEMRRDGTTAVALTAAGAPESWSATVTGETEVHADVARWGPATGTTGPEVAFVVTVPAGTNTSTGIWISGEPEALGAWNGAGVRLGATRLGAYAAVLAFASGVTVPYKVTRGSWETVEKDASGAELQNRTVTVGAGITRAVATVARWRDDTPIVTGDGDFEIIPAVGSQFLSKVRDVVVWLPPGYEDPANAQAHYPVLYMHDGQNLMDAATSAFGTEWQVDETAESLVKGGEVEPLIIVGVGNSPDRIPEYTPTVDASEGQGGKADAYGRFLVEELKPMIDGTYRTRPEASVTGLAGSSLGGLASMYLGLKYAGTFTRIGVVSPSVWWDERVIVDDVEALNAKLPLRIWLDIGTLEGDGESVTDTRLLRDALVAEGWVIGVDLAYTEIEGGQHDEAAWAARFDDILRWLYPAPPGNMASP